MKTRGGAVLAVVLLCATVTGCAPTAHPTLDELHDVPGYDATYPGSTGTDRAEVESDWNVMASNSAVIRTQACAHDTPEAVLDWYRQDLRNLGWTEGAGLWTVHETYSDRGHFAWSRGSTRLDLTLYNPSTLPGSRYAGCPQAYGTIVSGDGTPAAPAPVTPSSQATAPTPEVPGITPGTRPTARTTPAAADPRWRFFSADRRPHTSPWFAGAHRVMIGYGCTVAPYYTHDPRCPGSQGFHHGIDVAMPCGTELFAGRGGTVVDPASTGAPGAAYGPYAFRIRGDGLDVLIGHVLKVYVRPGDVVERGQLIARANDQGAPDGCHLHLEVRRAGGGLASAVDPAPYLLLSTD